MTSKLEDRKISSGISLSGGMWEEADKRVREDGFTSRSQLIETLLKKYNHNRKNSGSGRKNAHPDMFSDRQMRSYFGDLERHLRASSMEEVRKDLPFIRHAYELANGLTRTVKRDISRITDRDEIERARLEGLRNTHDYNEKHGGGGDTKIVPTREYVSEAVAKFRAKLSETNGESNANTNTNSESAEIELRKLVDDAARINRRKLKTETNTETNAAAEIIEDEVPNPYSEEETVFQ